jgi:hypothetical protein
MLLRRPIMRMGLAALLAIFSLGPSVDAQEAPYQSHPPARPLPRANDRSLADGAMHFVDPTRGDDGSDGTIDRPWRTLAHSVAKLASGESLVLRGGTYYEHVTARLAGTHEQPIAIRSYPGELAILDGGLREFYESPDAAWEPCPEGAAGEFRSTKIYPGLAKGARLPDEEGQPPAVFGNFGDSLVPLQAYRYRGDLQSDNPFWNVQNKVGGESFVYCGPGVFYDAASGRIHCRFAHTQLSGLGNDNYRGETDPRTLPLVIAGGDRPVLELRECQNVRLVDLVLRGSREPTLQIHDSRNIELDGVTAYGGSSAMQVLDTHGLRMQHCACRGLGAPWTFRGMLKYRSVEARLFSASRWDPTGRDNRDFEIRYCEFTDSVDGVFIGNVRGVRFHHNLVENVTDDGVFLTAGTVYDGQTHGGDVHIYQNHFARILTTFAFGVGHGRQKMNEKGRQTGSGVWIYRNVFDQRRPVWYHWPSGPDVPQEISTRGRFGGDHGGPAWEPMWIYHNTIIAGGTPRYDYGCDGLIHGLARGTSRRVFNNIVCLTEGTPGNTLPPPDADFAGDGNLFWSLAPNKPLGNPFAKFRASQAYEQSKEKYSAGWTTHDRVADPRLAKLLPDWREPLDLKPMSGSPLVDAGVSLPKQWPDFVGMPDRGEPDIGALSLGVAAWHIGVMGRLDVSGSAADRAPPPGEWTFGKHPPRDDAPRQRALIVEGYPAFDAPIAAYLLRKAGWKVDTVEKSWCDPARFADYGLVVYDGSLARAKVAKTAFDAADLPHVRRFLDGGGRLVLMRERHDLFASPESRRFWNDLVGTAMRQPQTEQRFRLANHPWLKHLAADANLDWLGKGTPIATGKGQSLITTESEASLLHVVPVGQGRLIYIGWSPAASIPHGRMSSTVEQEQVFEDQVKILHSALAGTAE